MDLLVQDFIFRFPAKAYIRQRGALNQCTWGYLFNLDMPLSGGRVPWHCADIPFVFHNTKLVPLTRSAASSAHLEEQIFVGVMAFVKTGNPNNAAIPTWPCSTGTEESTMLFDKNTRLCVNHDSALMAGIMKYSGLLLAYMQQSMGQIRH